VTVSGTAPEGAHRERHQELKRSFPMLLENDEAIRVVDDHGTAIGVVNRTTLQACCKPNNNEQRLSICGIA
jgi:hypothetical protein